MVRRRTPSSASVLELFTREKRLGNERVAGHVLLAEIKGRPTMNRSTTTAAAPPVIQGSLLSLSRGAFRNSPHRLALAEALGEISSGHIPMPRVRSRAPKERRPRAVAVDEIDDTEPPPPTLSLHRLLSFSLLSSLQPTLTSLVSDSPPLPPFYRRRPRERSPPRRRPRSAR